MTCDEYFEMKQVIGCIDGEWKYKKPFCRLLAKDCGPVPPGNSSTGTVANGTTYPSEADYTCDEGFEIASGNSKIACLLSGQWDVDNILVCRGKDCGQVPSGDSSTGTAASGTTYPNEADYTCDEGHEIASGRSKIACLATGQWDVGNILVCRDCVDPLDVVLVVDGSGSVGSYHFNKMINILADVTLSGFYVDSARVHVGLIVYSTDITDIINMSSDPNQLQKDIRALKHPWGNTHTGKGIAAAQQMLLTQGRPGVPNVMIVLTDGKSTENPQSDATAAKDSGTVIYSIGIGSGAYMAELRQIASDSDKVQKANDFGDIRRTLSNLC
ncbi:hypothetical protein LOTGIDRAFT_171761 [Lottia gigantea]|uniref:VWFA domain-containing protein n=1 Tax=Lottia gigantea TaxID=225164 RepID=V4AGI5_LOTGI|nr:hypothetical protein LOTGIDRAFT_171761 [Lottia gigantea]ESP03154.1 hypothetical protein LOTGIDRAFT_171761 [Lottia gigantea]